MQLTAQNVKEVLIDASMTKPVFTYFYVDADECAAATTAVQSAIGDNNAYVNLVMANVQDEVAQAIAMQIGLRNVPALIVFKEGRPVDALQGADVTEKLNELLNKYMPSEEELALRAALEAEAAGDLGTALQKIAKVYNDNPKNSQAKFIYIRLCLKQKNLDKAKELIDSARGTYWQCDWASIYSTSRGSILQWYIGIISKQCIRIAISSWCISYYDDFNTSANSAAVNIGEKLVCFRTFCFIVGTMDCT